MLLGYDRPTLTASIIGGLASWVGDGTPDKLIDGRPQSVARITGLSDSSPAISEYTQIDFSWSGSRVPRVACLLAPSASTATALPVGLKVQVYGRLASGGGYTYALGGNSLTQRTRRLPGGGTGCFWVFDSGLSACNGISLRIYNDVGGATVFDATTELDLGEFAVAPAVELCVRPGYEWQHTDPTITRRTLTSQRNRVPRTPYRSVQVELAPADAADAQNGGLANGIDWLRLDDYIAQAQDCIAVLRWRDENLAFDEDVLHANAIFGFAENSGGMSHVPESSRRDRRYTKRLSLTEIPA